MRFGILILPYWVFLHASRCVLSCLRVRSGRAGIHSRLPDPVGSRVGRFCSRERFDCLRSHFRSAFRTLALTLRWQYRTIPRAGLPQVKKFYVYLMLPSSSRPSVARKKSGI